MTKPTKWLCAQRRQISLPRLIWVFAGRTLILLVLSCRGSYCLAVRMKKAGVLSYPLSTAKTLIRLGGCPGWSESSLGAHSFWWFCHVTHVVAHIVYFLWITLYTALEFQIKDFRRPPKRWVLPRTRAIRVYWVRSFTQSFWNRKPFDCSIHAAADSGSTSESSKYPTEGLEEKRSDWTRHQLDRFQRRSVSPDGVYEKTIIGPRHEKTCLRGLRPALTQTGLLSYIGYRN